MSILLQNSCFVSRRFLTCFFLENIDSGPVNVLSRNETEHDLVKEPSDKDSDEDGPTTATEVLPLRL